MTTEHPTHHRPELPSDDPARMLSVDEARERILAAIVPPPAESTPLLDALGLTLAEDLVSAVTLPPFPNSAMDGFAVRAADTSGAGPETPVVLSIVGESAAGSLPTIAVEPSTAVRIMTGAPIPQGADTVVRFEETDETERRPADRSSIGIRRAARPGENIRPAGEDLREGDLVLRRGAHLGPAQLSLLAAIGQISVTVHRRPKVAILATGNELVDPAMEPGPGQIRDSNTLLVAAVVRHAGGEPMHLGIARDDDGELTDRMRATASVGADLIVTTGGVSVGDYDVVKRVLQREGRIDLWQVRIKPGKPLAFGWIGQTPLLGLPGNPVAAGVACELFLRPVIDALFGRAPTAPGTIDARVPVRIENRGGRRNYVRVRLELGPDGWTARPVGNGGAGVLSSLAAANGLLVIDETVTAVEPGQVLPVIPLDR